MKRTGFVTVIEEVNHGVIGACKNFESAVKYLIDKKWIDEHTEVYDGTNFNNVRDMFGENWKNIILDLYPDDFENFFNESFYIYEVDVFE